VHRAVYAKMGSARIVMLSEAQSVYSANQLCGLERTLAEGPCEYLASFV